MKLSSLRLVIDARRSAPGLVKLIEFWKELTVSKGVTVSGVKFLSFNVMGLDRVIIGSGNGNGKRSERLICLS